MARTKDSAADQVKKTAKKPVDPPEKIDTTVLVPTGSTLLNLACSDSPRGGFALGKMVNLIGDSSSGKTLLALSMFAEMAQQKRFHDYRLIYDDVEAACEFDMEYMFGERTAARIKPTAVDDEGEPKPSNTVENFQGNLLNCVNRGEPFVYVLDSFDALTSEEELKKIKEQEAAKKKEEKTGVAIKVSGAYGAEKAKASSRIMRIVCRALKRTESLLIIISQTRDKLNTTFPMKTRSGGHALKFYATHEMWMAVEEELTREVNKRKRIIGVSIRVKVTKNKINGKHRQISFSAYYDYGVDNVESCVDFLVSEGALKKSKGTIISDELDYEGGRGGLVKHIEDNDLEPKLIKLVAATWAEIEESLKLNRKRKYT